MCICMAPSFLPANADLSYATCRIMLASTSYHLFDRMMDLEWQMSLYIVMSHSVDDMPPAPSHRCSGHQSPTPPRNAREAGRSGCYLWPSRLIASWLQSSSTNQCRHPQATSNSSRQRPTSTTRSLQQINCHNILESRRRSSRRNVVVPRAAKQVSLKSHRRIVEDTIIC